jgi:hypothetical protein
MALSTFENVPRKYVMAFLTLAIAISQFPGFMCAFMILHQVSSFLFNTSLAHIRVHTVCVVISVNYGIGPSDKATFLPLWARTSFPTVTTKVAELGSAMTGFDTSQ